jgi:hypothetical protein
MKQTHSQPIILSALLSLTSLSASAATIIAQQTFDTDQDFSKSVTETYTDGLYDGADAYTGSGLGFTAYGQSSGGTGIRTTGGIYTHGHMSESGSKGFQVGSSAKYGALSVPTGFATDKSSGFMLFNTVDLSGFNSVAFTVDIAPNGAFDTDSGTGGNGPDAAFVRLFLNYGTPSQSIVDLLTFTGFGTPGVNTPTLAAGVTYTDGTLSYNIADSVTSAELLFGFQVDSGTTGSPDQYEVDNVLFQGTAVPEPTTTALLGLGGLALILRRRK